MVRLLATIVLLSAPTRAQEKRVANVGVEVGGAINVKTGGKLMIGGDTEPPSPLPPTSPPPPLPPQPPAAPPPPNVCIGMGASIYTSNTEPIRNFRCTAELDYIHSAGTNPDCRGGGAHCTDDTTGFYLKAHKVWSTRCFYEAGHCWMPLDGQAGFPSCGGGAQEAMTRDFDYSYEVYSGGHFPEKDTLEEALAECARGAHKPQGQLWPYNQDPDGGPDVPWSEPALGLGTGYCSSVFKKDNGKYVGKWGSAISGCVTGDYSGPPNYPAGGGAGATGPGYYKMGYLEQTATAGSAPALPPRAPECDGLFIEVGPGTIDKIVCAPMFFISTAGNDLDCRCDNPNDCTAECRTLGLGGPAPVPNLNPYDGTVRYYRRRHLRSNRCFVEHGQCWMPLDGEFNQPSCAGGPSKVTVATGPRNVADLSTAMQSCVDNSNCKSVARNADGKYDGMTVHSTKPSVEDCIASPGRVITYPGTNPFTLEATGDGPGWFMMGAPSS